MVSCLMFMALAYFFPGKAVSEKVKQLADLKLSMSDMTFPHHLARVMAAEQIYRSFKILEGSAYHK